jgi:hypothetical protein
MIRAAILIALASPAVADDVHQFGQASISFNGREVVFHNSETRRSVSPQDFYRDLTDGITVRVVIMQEPGDIPDTMTVIPPAGYIAIPESVTVHEEQSGVIIVTPEGLS